MPDKLTPERRSANMSRIRSTGSVPEMEVRRAAFALGYRYRLHRRDLPGKPDLVFPQRRKVIFVHGCFWHQHEACREGRPPGSNTSYWLPKLDRNKQRDTAALQALEELGWSVLVLWECETTDPKDLAARLRRFLGR